MDVKIGDRVIVHKDPFAYISHPSITVTRSGDWLAAFNHSRRREHILHPPDDPLFRTLVCRSGDRGASWDRPEFAPDFDWYGTECPGIACTPDGAVLLSEFRFAWYPIGLARRMHAKGQRLALHLIGKGWTEDIREEDIRDGDWEQSRHPWARGRHGVYIHRSTDDGRSFDKTVAIDTAPYEYGYSRTGIVSLSDGRLAYALGEKHGRKIRRRIYIMFSSDNGLTWSAPEPIVEKPQMPFGEPDIAESSPGELLCILRECKETRHLYSCRSLDGGKTWSKPEQTAMYGYPGHVIRLTDGRLLCTYGRREEPYGIRACLSEDDGGTWEVGDEIVLRDDLPNGDLGYPTTIEFAPNRLFSCYYGQTPDGVTCVQGTWFDLPT